MARLVPRTLLALLGIAVVLGATVLTASPAQADHVWPSISNEDEPVEQDNGTLVSAPNTSGMYCIDDDWTVDPDAYACWESTGDYWYVKDNRANGRSAVAMWEDNSCNSFGYCDVLYRQGICRNPHGAGTWARCNKNYYEGHTIWFAAGDAEGFHVVDNGGWIACAKQWPCRLTA